VLTPLSQSGECPDCDLQCRGHGVASPPAATDKVAATEGKFLSRVGVLQRFGLRGLDLLRHGTHGAAALHDLTG
jgi:hypothetical protein